MRRLLAVGLLCGALGACMGPMGPPLGRTSYGTYWPPQAAPTATRDNLQTARQACNKTYPPKVGNYAAHADCVNEAVERYAVQDSRHSDLVRLQERVRSQISARIDQGTLSVHDGELEMQEADRDIAAAQRERDAANKNAADQHVAKVQSMLNR